EARRKADLQLKENAKNETANNLENGVGEAILRAIREDLK
ncbi:HAD family phosphatase, partial [Enterococcus faecalis]